MYDAVMPRKPAPKPDNPEQFRRFIETAREVEVDESPDALERAIKQVIGEAKTGNTSKEVGE